MAEVDPTMDLGEIIEQADEADHALLREANEQANRTGPVSEAESRIGMWVRARFDQIVASRSEEDTEDTDEGEEHDSHDNPSLDQLNRLQNSSNPGVVIFSGMLTVASVASANLLFTPTTKRIIGNTLHFGVVDRPYVSILSTIALVALSIRSINKEPGTQKEGKTSGLEKVRELPGKTKAAANAVLTAAGVIFVASVLAFAATHENEAENDAPDPIDYSEYGAPECRGRDTRIESISAENTTVSELIQDIPGVDDQNAPQFDRITKAVVEANKDRDDNFNPKALQLGDGVVVPAACDVEVTTTTSEDALIDDINAYLKRTHNAEVVLANAT